MTAACRGCPSDPRANMYGCVGCLLHNSPVRIQLLPCREIVSTRGAPFLILTEVSCGWVAPLADPSCSPLPPGYFMDHSVAFRDLPIR